MITRCKSSENISGKICFLELGEVHFHLVSIVSTPSTDHFHRQMQEKAERTPTIYWFIRNRSGLCIPIILFQDWILDSTNMFQNYYLAYFSYILSFSLHAKWFRIQHWWTSYRPLLLLYSIHLPRLWLRQSHKIPASSLSHTAGAPPNTKTLKWLLSCNIKPSWKFSKLWIDWFWNSDSQRKYGMPNS